MPYEGTTLPRYPDNNNNNQSEEDMFMQSLGSQAPENIAGQSTPEDLYAAEPSQSNETIQPLTPEQQLALAEVSKHINVIRERIVVTQHTLQEFDQ